MCTDAWRASFITTNNFATPTDAPSWRIVVAAAAAIVKIAAMPNEARKEFNISGCLCSLWVYFLCSSLFFIFFFILDVHSVVEPMTHAIAHGTRALIYRVSK